jgi:hypothetical protein
MNTYYISGHSEYDKSKNFVKVHNNQYIIFTTLCGQFSYVNEHSPILKYLNTNNGINRLKRELNNGIFQTKYSNIYNVKIKGQKFKNQLIVFQNQSNENKFKKGTFIAPMNVSNITTKGTNHNSIGMYFNMPINYNTSYHATLTEIIGDYPGIFIIDTCRGLNSISIEKNRIAVYHNANITYLQKPKTRPSRRNSGATSIVTQNLVKQLRETTLNKSKYGTTALSIRHAHKNIENLRKNNNEVSSRIK